MKENEGTIFLAGPTAVGKSAVALQIAEREDAEIISVDSMQVYRGMDIGTDKPTLEEQSRVKHHLIDVVEIVEPFDAARFVRLARKAATEIRSRGRLPIFCGGAGLYFQAYLEGLGKSPPRDAKMRAELDKISLQELISELEKKDPRTAERIDKKNRRRLVRAIEVIRITGEPFSEQRACWNARKGVKETNNEESTERGLFVVLQRSREELNCRIEQRVDRMFKRGIVEETKNLMQDGLRDNLTAMQAIGYRQVAEFLDGGPSLEETIKTVKQRSRLYAKKQIAWFKKQQGVRWMDVGEGIEKDAVVEKILGESGRVRTSQALQSKTGRIY